MLCYIIMEKGRLRSHSLLATIAIAIAVYFVLSFLFFPGYFKRSLGAKYPAPEFTSVLISKLHPRAGEPVEISVSATNNGDEADVQTVSVSFPNITRAEDITVVSQDFLQKPIMISAGSRVGASYEAQSQTVVARYAAIEAQSWPWETHKSFTINLRVAPHIPGHFLILIKSVALPHNGNSAHFPRSGVIDQQNEFAQPYWIEVTNP